MIVTFLIEGFLSMVIGLFNLVPDLPSMPSGFMTPANALIDTLSLPIGFIQYVLSYELLLIIVPMIILLLNFTWLWHLTIFILRKIPILGIK